MGITIRLFLEPPAEVDVAGFNPLTGAAPQIEFPFRKAAEVSAWLRAFADTVDQETAPPPMEKDPALGRRHRAYSAGFDAVAGDRIEDAL
jgi:hypothetical protein